MEEESLEDLIDEVIFGKKVAKKEAKKLGKKKVVRQKQVKAPPEKVKPVLGKKMSVRVRKFTYTSKRTGEKKEYFYKYGYWREGEQVKCRYLGKAKGKNG